MGSSNNLVMILIKGLAGGERCIFCFYFYYLVLKETY